VNAINGHQNTLCPAKKKTYSEWRFFASFFASFYLQKRDPKITPNQGGVKINTDVVDNTPIPPCGGRGYHPFGFCLTLTRVIIGVIIGLSP